MDYLERPEKTAFLAKKEIQELQAYPALLGFLVDEDHPD